MTLEDHQHLPIKCAILALGLIEGTLFRRSLYSSPQSWYNLNQAKSAMTVETSALTLIRTKMQRPRLPGDLIPRRRLLDPLHAGSDRKLTLISAMAGSGRTTLLALAELILYAPAQDAIAAPVLMFAGNVVKGLKVKGFVPALIAAAAIVVVSWLIDGLIRLLS